MIPVLAGFIANSIAGRAAIAPAMPIFFIPLTAGIAISIIFIYVLGAPIGYVMNQIQAEIEKAYNSRNIGILVRLGLGIILGAMAGFDMGGPINKIAFITCSALITAGVQQPMGAMSAAIPVAPLGMGLSTILFKRFYSEEEQGMGIAAMIMGTIGISEGAIPFAIRDSKRAIICNVLGSAVARGIASAFMLTDAAAHGGPIVAILGAIPYGPITIYYFIAVAAGVGVTTSLYGIWQLKDAGAFGSVKESHVLHLEQLKLKKHQKIKELKLEIKNLKQQNASEAKINNEKINNEIKETEIKNCNIKLRKKYKEEYLNRFAALRITYTTDSTGEILSGIGSQIGYWISFIIQKPGGIVFDNLALLFAIGIGLVYLKIIEVKWP